MAAALGLHRCTLSRVLGEVRGRLLELAAFLPYSGTVTTHNVGTHARTIMQLTALVGSAQQGQQGAQGPAGTPASCAGADAVRSQRGAQCGSEGAAPQAPPAVQQPHSRRQVQGAASGLAANVESQGAAAAQEPAGEQHHKQLQEQGQQAGKQGMEPACRPDGRHKRQRLQRDALAPTTAATTPQGGHTAAAAAAVPAAKG